MTSIIAYHEKTHDLALLESDGKYWIGSYGKFLTHQNGEPPYYLINGYFASEEEGVQVLQQLTGNEF